MDQFKAAEIQADNGAASPEDLELIDPTAECIDLTNCGLQSLDIISNASTEKLKCLMFRGNQISSLEPLKNFEALEQIDAYENRILSIHGLQTFTNLRYPSSL